MIAAPKGTKSIGEPLDELFSILETARKVGGVSPWTVRAWISQGRLEKTKVGARTMVSARAIREFLNDCAEREACRLASAEGNNPGPPTGPPKRWADGSLDR